MHRQMGWKNLSGSFIHSCIFHLPHPFKPNAAPVAMNGGSNLFFFFSNNLRPLWASHLFISSILLNSRKVRRPAFPRKWILIYSGQKKKTNLQQIILWKANKCVLPEKSDLKIPGTSAQVRVFQLLWDFFSCLIISWNYRNTETKGMKCLLFCFLEMGAASSDSGKSLKTLAFTSASTFICYRSTGGPAVHQSSASLNEMWALQPQELKNRYTSPTDTSAPQLALSEMAF